jgi:hypothetical protein
MSGPLIAAVATVVAAFITSQSGWFRTKTNGRGEQITNALLLVGLVAVLIGVWRVESGRIAQAREDCRQDQKLWDTAAGNAELIATPLEVPGAMGDLLRAIDERNELFGTVAARNLDRLGPRPEC